MTANRAEPRPSAGVYLHWPFCERKCPYCDFYTFGREHPDFGRAPAYAAALIDEIRTAPARLGLAPRPPVDTIYFGGGTPSLMGARTLANLMATLGEVFELAPDREITLEVNPTTAEAAELEGMLAAGVNRLSVGCQSFNDRVLAGLGRVHDAATTRCALERMRALGIANLSLDLIFGAPTQSLVDLAADLDELLAFAPEHVSAYNMTIHEGTPFDRRQREGRLALASEDEQAAMFELMLERLAEAGYEHYEISNWARPGRRSRHNSKYWRAGDVYGFGVSAHGVVDGRRVENPRALGEYLNSDARRLALASEPPADERARRGEIMMLALRRVDGVGWDELDHWLGADARACYAGELDRLSAEGLIEPPTDGLRLTRRGILLSDMVMERFF